MRPQEQTGERQPHADLDIDSRRLKAVKIEHLLGLDSSTGPIRLLEIGTGSGVIAHHFATHPELECEVAAVDLVDQRVVRDGYVFELVEGTRLPFDAGSFDVVLSNHVIEHVGDRHDQRAHLVEIRRVMDVGAIGYLATPNRWAPVEPHFRVPLLSWLPHSLRDRYLELWRRGDYYDCEPLSKRKLDRLLEESGLRHQNLEAGALRVANEVEPGSSAIASLFRKMAVGVLEVSPAWSPTLVCLLFPASP